MQTTKMQAASRSSFGFVCVLFVGIVLRFLLYTQHDLQKMLSARPELVTATSSLHRVKEAIALFSHLGTPYAGDVFHQPPLVFALFYQLFQWFSSPTMKYVACASFFVLLDVLIAIGVRRLCINSLAQEEGIVPTMEKDTKQAIWLHDVPVSPLFAPDILPTTVAAIYLLNPYSIASTVAMSTVSLTHIAVLYSLVFASEGALAASMVCVAMGTYLSVYPFFLLVPIVLLLETKRKHTPRTIKRPSFPWKRAFQCLLLFSLWISMLLYMSFLLSNGWDFITETYVWVAKYSDLTPNIGIFWYFFMEVFDRFIRYFLLVLHVHPLIYIVPIYLRFHHRPQAYACALVGILTLFQAYPTFGDFGFFLTIMAIHPKTIMTMKNRYVYALGLGVATCMLPVMWFLWLFPASGNANFFYNQTLVYQIFNSQVITAFVGATMKRDKDVEVFKKRNTKAAVEDKKSQ